MEALRSSLTDDLSQVVDDRLLAWASTCESDVAVGADQDERVPGDAVGAMSLLIAIDQRMFCEGDCAIRGHDPIRVQRAIVDSG